MSEEARESGTFVVQAHRISEEATEAGSWDGEWKEGRPEKPLRPGSKLEVAFKYLKVWSLSPTAANPKGSRKIQCQLCDKVLKYDNHIKDASNLLKHFNNTRPDHQKVHEEIQACESGPDASSSVGSGAAGDVKPKAKKARTSASKSRAAISQEQIAQQEADAAGQAPELKDWLETVQLRDETKRKILVAFVSEEIFNLSTLRSIQISELEKSCSAWSELKIGAKATLTVALEQLKSNSG